MGTAGEAGDGSIKEKVEVFGLVFILFLVYS